MLGQAKPKKCKTCGKEFTPQYSTTTRYCSAPCAYKVSPKQREYRTKAKARIYRQPIERVQAKIDAKTRDNHRCMLAGVEPHECDWRREAHHILYLSEGGPDAQWNLITLCHHAHHNIAHANKKWQPKLLEIVGGKFWFDKVDTTDLGDAVKLKIQYLKNEALYGEKPPTTV